jgi:hypothetical protein
MEDTEGVFNGQEFAGIWRNVIPDHLAILPEGVIGACSVADGSWQKKLDFSMILGKLLTMKCKERM